MRRLGVTCDHLLSTDIVLADGRKLTCSATENEDLFWAVRGGGGGNFGIHTAFVLDTHPADNVTCFDITFVKGVEEGFRAMLAQARTAPRALGLKIYLRATRENGANVIVLQLLGQWAGPSAELDAWLAPIRAVASADPKRDRVETLPYWDAQAILSDEGLPQYAYERSRYVTDDLPESAIALIVERLKAWPGVGSSATWMSYLTGGAISDVAADATAFVHRGDWLLSTFNAIWAATDAAQDPDGVLAGLEWLDASHDALSAYTSAESYQNFVDPSQTDWKEAYYGGNLARLVDVKKKYDPTNTFHFEQSIPLTI